MNDHTSKNFDFKAHAELTAKAKAAEWYETPDWAAERVLDVELLTPRIVDPCAGRGVLGRAVRGAGYNSKTLYEYDKHDWPGRSATIKTGVDWLNDTSLEIWKKAGDFSVIMNPPFSLACEFVDRAFELGARKVLMFQRFSFLESSARRDFWSRRMPARIWLCGDRAHCWRGDMPEEDMHDEDGKLIKGKKGRSSPTAHAWFTWEREHMGTGGVHRLYK